MQAAKIGIYAFCFLVEVAHAAPSKQHVEPAAPRKLDAGILGASVVATPTPTQAGTSAKVNRSKSIANDESVLDAKAEKDLLSTMSSLSVVISKTPPGPGRDRLVLNRAIANNRYGRQKLISAKRYALTDEIKRYLNAAIADADLLINNPKTTRDMVIMAHDVAATSALYLEKNDLSRAHFLEELKLNPPPEKAGRIGLTLAEQDFNQGNYAEAARFYTTYFSKMTPKWKELSLYKLGWCAINTKQPEQAQAYFLKIAHAASPTGIGRDAIRDLAFLTSSKSGSVPEVISTQQKIPKIEDQTIYLSDVLANMEALNFPNEHAQIADRLLQIEKNPVERVTILLSQIRMQKKAYASVAHLRAYTVTADYIQKLDGKSLKAVLAKHQTSLEVESENIFRAYIDTYAGRVKTLEGAVQTPPQLFSALKFQLQFYRKYFVAAAHFPIVIELWENLCIDNKDWAGVDEITQYIISDQPRLGILLENAYLNQIAALDELNSDPARRSSRLKEYVEKFPKSARWPQVAKWYAQIEMAAEHYDVALSYWSKLMTAEASDDNFYQLQFCRFKLADYNAVLEDPRNKTFLKPQSHLMDLYRETSLKVAELSKANDPARYRRAIEEFISLSTDPAKTRIARLDYLNYLIANNLPDEAYQRYTALPADEKKAPAYANFKNDIWKKAIEKEIYELAIKIAPSPQQLILSTMLAGHPVNPKDLDALSHAETAYYIGLYALFEPDYAIRFLKNSSVGGSSRDLLVLAYRMKYNQWQLIRNAELEKALGKKYAFAEVGSETLQIEKDINSVRFPDLSKLGPKRQASAVERNLTTVRQFRKDTLKAIKGKSPETQFHVLEKMEQLENKMAQFLLSSPVPAGLTPEQTTEYQGALKGAADEFTQQGQQFKLLADKSKEGMDKGRLWLAARTLPQPDMGDWVWPDGITKNEKLQSVFKIAKNGNLIGAMALLDFNRTSELPTDEAFFQVRTGTILQSKPSDTLRIYLLEELEKSKQQKLIEKWATMTKHPIPEAL
ncbi:MAG: hypothetical protein H7333_03690 [Bdellovibrionales bacterium]|nr:hypothetical protein [Oligoflexia bacterium]